MTLPHDTAFVFLRWDWAQPHEKGKQKHGYISIYSLFPCHSIHFSNQLVPLTPSLSSATERMDLSAIPSRTEAKTKTQKNLLLWHFVPSHLHACQSQWTGVWGICVHITMVMALCLPRLPGGGWRVGGEEEGAALEQVANQTSTKMHSNEGNEEEDVFLRASTVCNIAFFSPVRVQSRVWTQQLTPKQSKESWHVAGKAFHSLTFKRAKNRTKWCRFMSKGLRTSVSW